jgi:hypothetical protein
LGLASRALISLSAVLSTQLLADGDSGGVCGTRLDRLTGNQAHRPLLRPRDCRLGSPSLKLADVDTHLQGRSGGLARLRGSVASSDTSPRLRKRDSDLGRWGCQTRSTNSGQAALNRHQLPYDSMPEHALGLEMLSRLAGFASTARSAAGPRLHCWSDVRGGNGAGAGAVDRESLPDRVRPSHGPGYMINQASRGSFASPPFSRSGDPPCRAGTMPAARPYAAQRFA